MAFRGAARMTKNTVLAWFLNRGAKARLAFRSEAAGSAGREAAP